MQRLRCYVWVSFVNVYSYIQSSAESVSVSDAYAELERWWNQVLPIHQHIHFEFVHR
jgi:hypothetical protein